jgi:sugar phosphate isomerase/epimerase
MKLAMMAGDVGRMVSAADLRSMGFDAVQMFFGDGPDGDSKDPTPEAIDTLLQAGDVALAAMTLHVDLVNGLGMIPADVERAIRCVRKTATLDGRFGDNERPVLIWHPSAYPERSEVDDARVFQSLCEALIAVCHSAEQTGVRIAVEITRGGSIGSAEAFMRVRDRVGSDALCVCMDAANFTPDRTPLARAVRMLGPYTIIAHGKDVRFDDTGVVTDYGPIGSGTLDYPAYVQLLQAHAAAPYFVLEYYRTRDDLLKARDIVRQALEHTT